MSLFLLVLNFDCFPCPPKEDSMKEITFSFWFCWPCPTLEFARWKFEYYNLSGWSLGPMSPYLLKALVTSLFILYILFTKASGWPRSHVHGGSVDSGCWKVKISFLPQDHKDRRASRKLIKVFNCVPIFPLLKKISYSCLWPL